MFKQYTLRWSSIPFITYLTLYKRTITIIGRLMLYKYAIRKLSALPVVWLCIHVPYLNHQSSDFVHTFRISIISRLTLYKRAITIISRLTLYTRSVSQSSAVWLCTRVPSQSSAVWLCIHVPSQSSVVWLCTHVPYLNHQSSDFVHTCHLNHQSSDFVHTCRISIISRLTLYTRVISIISRLTLYKRAITIISRLTLYKRAITIFSRVISSRNISLREDCCMEICYPCCTSLTHWGQVADICVGNLTIIASGIGLSPGGRHYLKQRRNVVNWIRRNKLQWNLIEMHIFSFQKTYLKMSSAIWRPIYLGIKCVIF